MPEAIDLHVHSSVSDGTETPTRLMRAAAAAGIGTVALTDHDSTAGWQEAAAAVKGTGMTLIPGIELSSQLDFASVHVLGYLFDPGDAELVSETARIRAERLSRAEAMVQRIRIDYQLEWDDVLAQTVPGATVGRPHIADALVAKGHVPTRSAAFESILHWQGGYYRPHYAPAPVEAVRLISEAGGVAVIAHAGARGPVGLLNDARMRVLVDAGLFGLEVYHRDNPPEARKRLLDMAKRFGLAVTGSSDYHGAGKVNELAENTTEPTVLEAMVARATGSKPVSDPRVE
jgi:predicted metal-dependent phosphoesterase TrpH